MLDLPAGGGVQHRDNGFSPPFLTLTEKAEVCNLSSGTSRTLLGQFGASCFSCPVDAFLWTGACRSAAQLGFLLFIPALLTEVREEGSNLSAGGSRRVYEERKGREELLRRLRQEDCKIGTSLGNKARPCLRK